MELDEEEVGEDDVQLVGSRVTVEGEEGDALVVEECTVVACNYYHPLN